VPGIIFGKDRRGGAAQGSPHDGFRSELSRTNAASFTHAAQVSELATEMKSYAKTLPGSVFTIDRRGDTSEDDPQTTEPVDAATMSEEQ